MRPCCVKCKRPLLLTRLVVAGQWLCAECLYEHEYGPTRRVEHTPRPNRRQPQVETLFPLPPAQPKRLTGRRAGDAP
jgi:hypothetical protein